MHNKKLEDYKRFGLDRVTIRECGCVYLDGDTRLEEPCNTHCDLPKEKINKINSLTELFKKQLSDLDYKTIKYLQGKLTQIEFDQVIIECEDLRDKINQIEIKINACTTIEDVSNGGTKWL